MQQGLYILTKKVIIVGKGEMQDGIKVSEDI